MSETLFGQDAIKAAIRACGGKATKTQAIEKLREMGAAASLAKTFGRGINKMSDAKEIAKSYEKGEWYYTLLEVPKDTQSKPVKIAREYYDKKLHKRVVVLKV